MKSFIHKFNIKYKKILDSSNVLFYSILGLFLIINPMFVFIYPYFPNKALLEPGGIDHSESSRNNQSELIRNSQCTCLAN